MGKSTNPADYPHLSNTGEVRSKAALANFWYWINERHRIYLRKQAAAPRPWTNDSILNAYRFCNVFRELDTVTQWIRRNMREPYAGHDKLWFLMAVARHINWPPTLAEIMEQTALPYEWEPDKVYAIMRDRKERGEKVYTSAYVLSATAAAGDKIRYTVYTVLTDLWKNVNSCRLNETIEGAVRYLEGFYGTGAFLAYEIASDLRHTWHLHHASDIMTWANPGPGAQRGLNRIFNRQLDWKVPREMAVAEMRLLLALANSRAIDKFATEEQQWRWSLDPAMPELEMRDIEHSLCEVDKYNRVLREEGRPRQKYQPSNGGWK